MLLCKTRFYYFNLLFDDQFSVVGYTRLLRGRSPHTVKMYVCMNMSINIGSWCFLCKCMCLQKKVFKYVYTLCLVPIVQILFSLGLDTDV
jgi:hypothetical protein